MIRPIMEDVFFLGQPSAEATAKDRQVAQDLVDTLEANADRCVGMAANMIGVRKRIIVFYDGRHNRVMFNPRIIAKKGAYTTEEGCLSLPGQRPTTRYQSITVIYQDERMRQQREGFTDFIAQIIQHECDHLEGIII